MNNLVDRDGLTAKSFTAIADLAYRESGL